MNFGEWILWLIYFFFMVLFFMMVFKVIIDIFRRDDIGGWGKAGWFLFLFVFTFLALLVYVISQGKQMAQRDMKQYSELQSQQADYIRSVAGNDATTQIKQAHDLLSSGAITQEEFDAIKTKALAS